MEIADVWRNRASNNRRHFCEKTEIRVHDARLFRGYTRDVFPQNVFAASKRLSVHRKFISINTKTRKNYLELLIFIRGRIFWRSDGYRGNSDGNEMMWKQFKLNKMKFAQQINTYHWNEVDNEIITSLTFNTSKGLYHWRISCMYRTLIYYWGHL